MTKPVRTPATYADLEMVPPDLVAEIIHGVLETYPELDERESALSLGLLGRLLDVDADGNDALANWLFLQQPKVALGDSIVVPALAGWTRDRMPRIPADDIILARPDWVCEFVTRRNASHQRKMKRDIYRESGVPYHWVFNASYPVLDTHRLDGDAWWWDGAAGSHETFSIAPFKALTISMIDLLPLDQRRQNTAGNA
jgi:hypothetical protein